MLGDVAAYSPLLQGQGEFLSSVFRELSPCCPRGAGAIPAVFPSGHAPTPRSRCWLLAGCSALPPLRTQFTIWCETETGAATSAGVSCQDLLATAAGGGGGRSQVLCPAPTSASAAQGLCLGGRGELNG